MQTARHSLITLSFLFLTVMNAFPQEAKTGIKFEHNTLAELKSMAAAQHKNIFIDCYTTWCGPCKRMSRDIFPDSAVGVFYNEHFINAKFDMEKGEGIEIANTYSINSYPTYLFLNSNGELVHRSGGSMPANEFIQVGQDAADPKKTIFSVRKSVADGARDPEMLYHYLFGSMMADLETDSLIRKTAFDNINSTTISSPWNRKIVLDLGEGLEGLKKITALREAISGVIGKDSLAYYFTNYERYHLMSAANSDRLSDYTEFKEILKSVQPTRMTTEEREQTYWKGDLSYAAHWKNTEVFMATAIAGIEKYYWDNSEQLNSLAWSVTELTAQPQHMKEADRWVTRSIELDENYYNLDTRAWIQYKLGNNALSKSLAEKAISAAKKAGESEESYKSTLELLDKLRK